MARRRFSTRTLLAVVVATGLSLFSLVAGQVADQCLMPFDEFAYSLNHGFAESVTPLKPWHAIPDGPFDLDRVVLSRTSQDGPEIWMDNGVVYGAQSGIWRSVDLEVSDPPTFRVTEILPTFSNGDVWAEARSSTVQDSVNPFELTLVKFNAEKGDFELPVSFQTIKLPTFPLTIIETTTGDTVWVIPGTGLFEYDLAAASFRRISSLPDMHIDSFAVDREAASIYLSLRLDSESAAYSELMQEGMLMKLDLATGELTPVALPTDEWPRQTAVHMDAFNRLWLGAAGYLQRGRWISVVPGMRADGTQPHPLANPMFSSSDGRVWFVRWTDRYTSEQGMAWYDPETGDGCMFTNKTTFRMIEDSDGNLWTVFDGKLYRYSTKG